jgi:hypothetical protein
MQVSQVMTTFLFNLGYPFDKGLTALSLGVEWYGPTVPCVIIHQGQPVTVTFDAAGKRANKVEVDFVQRSCCTLFRGGMGTALDACTCASVTWSSRGEG